MRFQATARAIEGATGATCACSNRSDRLLSNCWPLRLKLIVALLVIAGGHVSSAHADDRTFEILKGFDLPSNDYRSGFTEPRLKGISKKDCRRECAEDDRCQAFTFNAKANVCFLKAVVPQRRRFSGAISGIKRAGQHASRGEPVEREATDSAAQRSDDVSSEGGQAKSFEILKGFDLPSSDYRSGFTDPRLKGISKKVCRQECAEDGRCMAFTFNARANVCFLKAEVPQRRPFADAISGIKRATEQTASESRRGNVGTRAAIDQALSAVQAQIFARQSPVAAPPFIPTPSAAQASPPPSAGVPQASQQLTVTPTPNVMAANSPPPSTPTPSASAAASTPQSAAVDLSPTRARALAASASGMRFARGLPVVAGTRRTILTDDQVAAASSFLDFVELGLDPGVIEANAPCWARNHLPSSEAERYLSSGADAMSSRQNVFVHGEFVAWKGADEFEAERSKKAFLSDQAGALKAKAVSLPLEVLAVSEMTLPQYNEASGGFDLRFGSLNRQGVSFEYLGSNLGVAYGRPLCSNRDFTFSPPAAKLPTIWSIDATQAEALLRRLDQRKVYAAIKLRFAAMPLAKIDDKNNPSSRPPSGRRSPPLRSTKIPTSRERLPPYRSPRRRSRCCSLVCRSGRNSRSKCQLTTRRWRSSCYEMTATS